VTPIANPRYWGRLVAGTNGTNTGWITGTIGTLSPAVFDGGAINALQWNSGTLRFVFQVANTETSNAFTGLVINGTTLTTASASSFSAGPPGEWQWTTNPGLVNGNTYDWFVF
jgi:hypothetical protein